MFSVMHCAVGILHGDRDYNLARSGHSFALRFLPCQRVWHAVQINEPTTRALSQKSIVTNAECERKETQEISDVNPLC